MKPHLFILLHVLLHYYLFIFLGYYIVCTMYYVVTKKKYIYIVFLCTILLSVLFYFTQFNDLWQLLKFMVAIRIIYGSY